MATQAAPQKSPGTQVDKIKLSPLSEGEELEWAIPALFERNPIAMWVFDAKTLVFRAVNDAACELYGYERPKFLDMTASEFRSNDGHGPALNDKSETETPGLPARILTHITSTGARIRVLTFERRVRYERKSCIVAWSIDVTERDRTSVELRSTQIFLDAVVESIPSMVFVKDALDGRFVLLNKAGEDLLGLNRHDLIGKTDFDLFDPEDAIRFRAADQAVVASGKLVTIENEPLTTPEGTRSLRTQKVGVPDANGASRYLLGISEDVTERLRVEEQNRHLASHDVLTDLPNRLLFHTILEMQLEGGQETDRDFALLLLDLDRFKAVNDRFGHHAGDELLRQLSARMQMVKGGKDVVARLGGDEFGVLHLGEVDEHTASGLARDLISALREPFSVDGHVVSIGCSAGLVLNSRHRGSADALMKRADLALYAAKTMAKGGYSWFEFQMEEKADRVRILREELASALENQQLHIEYQPIVDTGTGLISCCEALLRWRHPLRGLVSPVEFIPAAEASGMIEPIGRWVLQRACHEASSWPQNVRVAVNLSAKQFSGIGLVADVAAALERSGLAPARLELEITESVLLTDSDENIRVLRQLKEMGVQIALDDFGTGYSSLAYLRQFAFDKLKIDRSFISDLTSSPENLAIVRAVIGLGKSFGATVTAEGVETHDQYQSLANEGCDQIQGYLISRPTSGEIVKSMLDRFQYCAS